MGSLDFPVIDMIATGKNILSLRREKGFTVRDLQEFFGFEEPQAIYRWQYGKTLPSVDNLYALSAILGVTMEEILVPVSRAPHENNQPHQEMNCTPSRGQRKNKIFVTASRYDWPLFMRRNRFDVSPWE